MTLSKWIAPVALAAASVVGFAASAALLDPALRPARSRGTLSAADDAAIRAALTQYQKVYEDFYATGGQPDLIDAFPATRDVKHHVFRDLGFVRDAGLVLVQDLATMTIRETRRTSGDTAEAVVYEEWNYVFQISGDRMPASQLNGLGQGFRYRLVRQGESWIVAGWDPEDLPQPAPDAGRKW